MHLCRPTPKEEAEAIIRYSSENDADALQYLERQLFAIYSRAQVLVSLAGVVITVTGFSGRLIAATNPAGQVTLVAGLGFVIIGAFTVYARVMRVTWLTKQLACGPLVDSLASIIKLRNEKTRAYSWGGYLMFLGLILYCVSISIMLMNPGPVEVPIR